jgi:hypothetical protein
MEMPMDIFVNTQLQTWRRRDTYWIEGKGGLTSLETGEGGGESCPVTPLAHVAAYVNINTLTCTLSAHAPVSQSHK